MATSRASSDCRRRRSCSAASSVSITDMRAADERAEALDREHHPVELGAARLGGLALGNVAGQPFFDLGRPSAKELPSLFERGGPDFDVGAQRADRGGTLLKAAASCCHRTTALENVRLFEFEVGQHRLELDHPGPLGIDARREIREMGCERLDLRVTVAPLGLDARQRVASRRTPACRGRRARDRTPVERAVLRRVQNLRRGRSTRRLLPRSLASAARSRASASAAPVAPDAGPPTRQPVRPKRSPSRVTMTVPG